MVAPMNVAALSTVLETTVLFAAGSSAPNRWSGE